MVVNFVQINNISFIVITYNTKIRKHQVGTETKFEIKPKPLDNNVVSPGTDWDINSAREVCRCPMSTLYEKKVL